MIPGTSLRPLPPLGWLGIVRLALVQTALGAIVVLTTSTMNRVMVVELVLPAMLPGFLVAMHHIIQISRPRLGYGSDVGGRRTPWIIGGMAVLAAGGAGSAVATALMVTSPVLGTVVAIVAFLAIGLGVGACGTSLLVLLAKRVPAQRRPAAATICWVMMIIGFIVTAQTAGHFLDPFSLGRLVAVTCTVSAIAMVVTVLAVWGVEGRATAPAPAASDEPAVPFAVAFRQVWDEPAARGFAVFVFVSMLAYSAQDLILEPFAGTVFGMTPGESTKMAGIQNAGVLLGMILVGVIGTLTGGRSQNALRAWTVGGCIASAAALTALAVGGSVGPGWPLLPTVFALGVSNGVFAVAAIGSMMERVGAGRESREGVRMGLWGAAQAVAFGLGGFIGTAAADAARVFFETPATAYGAVFVAEGLLFLVSALMALRLGADRLQGAGSRAVPAGAR
ncbi:BCD family MFS transporter [Rhodospirillum centenum]|uniref:Photosynthetic complex assembly protein (Possible Bch2, light harvesting pigment Major FacilitatorFamily protein Bch2), putative n=1 Tax=Rhodospirillum centenum (strain ATCC 51521 / SW) TaxID=414684 RepID=B6ITT3_RHOCS|nr:BCD family MFS transporter [Rhodospirillum centenum]ACI99469.1 photosynthetic complex assembly protein (possible Bch2, light harvesting pigment Major FacilitatorFamily protein Bch2), putative [Rhodospirillum centenum SW]